MQEAQPTYKIKSRNPKYAPTPIYDNAKNSIEHWEVFELQVSEVYLAMPVVDLVQPQKGLISSVRGFFETTRNRISRFLEVYDQENE
jgi:hypothetical protein